MSTQISLSFELICLVSWLLKNEKAMLNTLVKHAIQHGFVDELQQLENADQANTNENLYETLLDFLEHLEQTLIKNLETIHVDHKTKDEILPALQKIENDSLDFKTVWLSMQQTKAKVNKKHHKAVNASHAHTPQSSKPAPQDIAQPNATDILFEQILKNWKPNNKESVN